MSLSLDQLDTPFVAIDMDVMDNNLKLMQDRAAEHGLALRPHTKTHKQPALARRQQELGASSLTVAKLDEAQIMLEAGLDDLLIAYPLVGSTKAHRLATLMIRGLRPTVSIDSTAALKTLSLAASLSGGSVDVLVEVDTGFHRCGITGSAVVELAHLVDHEPGLRLRGLMSYAGHISGQTDPGRIRAIVADDDTQLGQYRRNLESDHLGIDTVTVGGTILSHNLDVLHHATEIRPGIYIFNDMGIVYGGAATTDDCAARVWSTVVSRPSKDRAVLDAGSKMLSTDGPLKGSYGFVVDRPGWTISRISEEHAVIELGKDSLPPEIGERVSIIPNHVCTVINLQNRVTAINKNIVTAILPVMGRGGTQ